MERLFGMIWRCVQWYKERTWASSLALSDSHTLSQFGLPTGKNKRFCAQAIWWTWAAWRLRRPARACCASPTTLCARTRCSKAPSPACSPARRRPRRVAVQKLGVSKRQALTPCFAVVCLLFLGMWHRCCSAAACHGMLGGLRSGACCVRNANQSNIPKFLTCRLQNYALSSGRRMWALVVFNEGPSAAGAGAMGVCFVCTCSQRCRVYTCTFMCSTCILQPTMLARIWCAVGHVR